MVCFTLLAKRILRNSLCGVTYISFSFQDMHKNNKRKILTNDDTLVKKNFVPVVDSDDDNDQWMCINNGCLYNSKN